MCPAATSTAMPSGNLHPVTMTSRSEPSDLSETMRSSLSPRRNRRPTVAFSPDARCDDCFSELTMCFHPKYSVGPVPDSPLRQAIPLLGSAADAVDVLGDSDLRQGLSAKTPSPSLGASRWTDPQLAVRTVARQ